jgi:KipI family sensor histidine kinase inhibitor
MEARVLPQGEQALLLQIGAVDAAPELATQRRLLDLVAHWRAAPGVIELVPGIHSLLLRLDPLRADPTALRRQLLAAWAAAEPREPAGRLHELPVRYDGEDLAAVAAHAGLSAAALVALHSEPVYEVACLGFQPGFPYLLGLPAPLQMPRRATPRLRVPAGSLAIGGPLCGIYPQASPGGWQLLGHCDTPLFDGQPLLRAGDRLRFIPHG